MISEKNKTEIDDEEFTYLTEEEAISEAKEITIRNLKIESSRISCISYSEAVSDFVLVNYIKEPNGWVQVFTTLPNDMRLENEMIQDSKIEHLANEGNLILAIRLYRTKYDVGLAEAKTAVDKMKTLN